MAWDGSDGDPGIGCMSGFMPGTPSSTNSTAITGLSIPVTLGDPVSMHVKFAGTVGYTDQNFQAKFRVTIGSSQIVVTIDYGPVTGVVDSGWLLAAGTIPATGTLTGASVTFSINSGLEEPLLKVFADSLYVVDLDPAIASFGFTRSAGGVPGAVMV